MQCKTPYQTEGVAKPGQLMFSAFGRMLDKTFMTVIDEHGRCLYERQAEGESNIDLRTHDIHGKRYYSFANVKEYIDPRTCASTRILLDKNFNFVKQIKFSADTFAGPIDFDCHDFELFDLDHYAAFHVVPQFDWTGDCVLDARVDEVQDGEIVFSWSARQNLRSPRPPAAPSSMGDFRGFRCQDLFHLNSIEKVESPGGYLISLATLNSVMFIPKRSPGERWAIGGIYDEFHIPKEAQFTNQHTAHWDAATQTLLLFDDGVESRGLRVLEFVLDIEHRKIKSWRTVFSLPQYSQAMGQVERCGDGCYDISTGDYDGPAFYEYDAGKKRTTFKLTLGGRGWYLQSYRVNRGAAR